jgi:hypothetical protein
VYKNIQNYSFSVFSHGCGTWSLAFMEEYRMKDLRNGGSKKIFGNTRDREK